MTETSELNDFNADIVDEFRANGGKVGGPFEGGTLLLLHTTGRQVRPAEAVAAGVPHDRRQDDHHRAPMPVRANDPAWVHNLRANPRAHIEVGTDAYDVIVRELPPDERDDT